MFECVEMMIHCSHQEGRGTDCIYSSKTISKVVGICLKLQVLKDQNLIKQSTMAFFFGKKTCSSPFCSFLRGSSGKNLEDKISENIELSLEFVEKILSFKRSYYRLEKLDYLLSQIISAMTSKDPTHGELLVLLKRLNQILGHLKRVEVGKDRDSNGEHIGSMLMSIIKGLPARD